MVIRDLFRAKRLDIFDLNYLSSTALCGPLDNNPAILPRKGFFVRLCAFLVHWLQELPKTAFTKRLPKSAILFFVSTKNHKAALSHLAQTVPDSVTAREKCDLPFRLPLFWPYAVAPFFLPCLLWRYLQADPYQRRAFRYVADIFNCEVGLSDHTMGLGLSVAAVALGANVIEEHFTLCRSAGGVDSSLSLAKRIVRFACRHRTGLAGIGTSELRPNGGGKEFVGFPAFVVCGQGYEGG